MVQETLKDGFRDVIELRLQEGWSIQQILEALSYVRNQYENKYHLKGVTKNV